MPHSFEHLKALLLTLMTLPDAERRQRLERLAQDDPELAREVASLLAHEDRGGALLATAGAIKLPAGDGLDDPGTDDELVTGVIGAYTLLGVLGEGGMGTVYRAAQTAPLQRTVALKLIRRGFDTDRIVARFEGERQMLARMSHVNIAQVFDAGSTPEGRPYFVMELVEGASITATADALQLDVDRRLALFLAVCRGVQHAHQKGIIHRDLKPSNVLVAEQSGALVPKIIDFGIAKAVEPGPGEGGQTRPGNLVGTPDYASPEQAGVVEAPVDTRTDVYALGIILYELLVGTRPFAFARSTPAEIQRVLGSAQPTAPSRLAAAPGQKAAAARGLTPERLKRRLAGDLDTITLRALERDPGDRYSSVEALAADIERHLDGRPIEARPPTRLYLAGKFVRRHAAGVAASVAVALLVAGFAAYASRQSTRLAEERDRARLQATTAESVSDFLVGMFREADPGQSRGTPVTARELLDRGAARAADLDGDPLVRARLMSTIGEVYHALGLYDEGKRLLLGALDTYESNASADPPGLAATLDTLGVVAHDTRDLAQSERYLRRALDLRRASLGEEHEDTVVTLTNLAITIRAQGRHKEAEPLYRQALAINRRVLGNEHVEVAWSLFSLGWALHQQGRLDEAEPLYREAADMQRRLLGPDHPDLAGTLNSLAGIPYYQGQFDEAARLWQGAFDIYQKVYGERHAATARAYHNLAMAKMGLGEFADAERLYRRAVELNLEMIGPDHPRTATTLHSHGLALWRLGRFDEADERLRTALAMREREGGPTSRETGATLASLALLEIDRDRLDSATALARRAAAIAEANAESWPAESARMLEAWARVLVASERLAEAVPQWRQTVALRDRAPDVSPQDRAMARAGLGHALALTGARDQGRALLDAARDALATSLVDTHPDRARVERLRAAVEGLAPSDAAPQTDQQDAPAPLREKQR
ncbi:MAG: serine/threonine-protein kinase [Acidobacteriota bacterium]|nr:serine/threonine-protein kinase [Acidobacteriota bacterium]